MTFNLGELEELFYNIQDIIEYFEQTNYDKKRFILFLSNGERINLQIPKESIAHLLGINTNYLISTGRFNSTNSYSLLKELSENAYRINSMFNENIIKYDNLFSPFIIEKIKNFKDNIKINIYETEFVGKHNVERTYGISERKEKCNYIIVKKNNTNWNVLYLVKNTDEYNNEYYIPMSNQFFDEDDKLKESLKTILKYQEITIINGIYINDGMHKKNFFLSIDKKLSKVTELEQYKEIFDCSIDTNHDFIFSLNETTKHMSNNFDDKNLISKITESIKKGEIININTDSYLLPIINSFNDFLCGKKSNENGNVSYTSMKQELEDLKSKLISLDAQIKCLKEDNDRLNINNQKLETENKEYKEIQEKIFSLLKKQRM